MRFYDALQLDPSILKKRIHAAAQSQERRKLTAAMTARSFLIVLFAITLIAPVTPVFGAENSPMGVALFCIFLGLRFVDFGYRYKTICNCIGALFMAAGIYGGNHSIFLRVANNAWGIVFGILFLVLFQQILKKYFPRKKAESASLLF